MDQPKKPKAKKEYVKEKLRQKRKESKKNKHRARLIVRNLPFDATPENLREHFEKFGEIDEVKLLKKEDGKLLGCGFVQFKLVQKAAKARHHLNGKKFLDRDIECDWALPKDKYEKEKNKVEPIKIKEEPIDDGYVTEIKTEKDDSTKEEISQDENAEVTLKKEDVDEEETVDDDVEEKEDDSDDDIEVKEEDEIDVKQKQKDEESEGDEDNDEESEGDEDDEDLKDEEDDNDNELEERKPRVISNDATEGKTIFIKNVPFTATNDDVRSSFSQFGPLYYALVCMDPLTEHSKGTAFVKFRNKEDADNCLATPGLTLMGNILDCQPAVTKDELNRKASEKNDKNFRQRDSRNLYLVKEGVVLAGSKAAEGVSASDMAKRLQVEQYKTQMLKNLNMFVARTRLIVHNIPAGWNDAKLRALFAKHCGPKAVIKEARIMRNMRMLDSKGTGKSKEFGFVGFTTHEAALEALRAVNNNPNIFSANKRPIVAFSIENRAKLQAKEKRLHNSRLKNPNSKNYNPNAIKSKQKHEEQRRGTKRPHQDMEETQNKFSGVAATPGNKKMRSKFNLRTQAQMHHENLKKEKKKKKFAKKTLQQKQQEFTKQPRQKINKKNVKANDNFSKLVSDYKQKLLSASASINAKKKKWFE